MNKALHALVYLILVLAVVALVFELNLYKKRELLGDRNRSLENFVVSFAKTIETDDAQKPATQPEINKDVQAVEAKAVENPDMENLLDDYPINLEQTNLETFKWDNAKDRLQLRAYYKLDPVTGEPVPDPANYNKPSTEGPGTMSELLNKLFDRATKQQANLNKTRAELSNMRSKLEATVTELNKLKQDDRADKVTIEELKAKIAQLEEAKANLEEQVQQLKSQIEELNGEITSLKDEVQHAKDDTEAVKEELEKEKKKSEQLKKMLIAERNIRAKIPQGGGQTSATTLTTGEKGKLVSANNDLMFAVVEFTDAAMKELLGPNRDGALPMLELDIKRKGFKGPAGERIGRIRLRVAVEDKNFVIADILGDWEQEKAQAGDVVFMD